MVLLTAVPPELTIRSPLIVLPVALAPNPRDISPRKSSVVEVIEPPTST